MILCAAMAHNIKPRFGEKPERTFGEGLNGKKKPKRKPERKKGGKRHKKLCLKTKKKWHIISDLNFEKLILCIG